MQVRKFTFSGHESFACKALWLKKGYDFIQTGHDFNAPEAVVQLGVGKNMVSAIRYWMRCFGLTRKEKITFLADYLFDDSIGKDRFVEDLGTLWLLHFHLVYEEEATLYNWFFTRFQRERKEFERSHVVGFVHRQMVEEDKISAYNEATVKKDVAVLLQNYVLPQRAKALDDYSSLLIDLNLIRTSDGKNYQFNVEGKRPIPWQVFLYAVLVQKGGDQSVGYDTLQETGRIFCMTDMELIDMCRTIEEKCKEHVRYSDIAGIRQLQFLNNMSEKELLDEYYG